MSLIRRMLLTEGGEEMPYAFEKILDTEFTLEETITTNSFTTFATVETGFKEGDIEIGDLILAEIRLIEDLETDNTKTRQLFRYEFLSLVEGYYGTAFYLQNPCYSYTPSTNKYSPDTYAGANSVFVYRVGAYMKNLEIAGRLNGGIEPTAGKYQLVLYKTDLNIRKDYRK